MRRAPRLILLGFVASLLVDSTAVHAHDLGIVRVHLREDSPSHYILDVRLPAVPEFAALVPALPPRCRMSDGPEVQPRQGAIDMRLAFDCAGAPLTKADVIRLPWPNQGAFVSADLRTGSTAGHFFEASEQGATLTLDSLTAAERRGWIEISRQYLRFGIEHILAGWDHLAFVLALCLIASGWHLMRLVSAFTLGHSLTLALASLGFVHVAAAPTEASIALSIVFVAREAVRGGDARLGHGAMLVFGFGLLHGLGFASALVANGVARAEFYVGLVTFNLGVEIGQLMFVTLVVTLGALGRALRLEARSRRAAAAGAAYAAGTMGVFWMLQRTLM